MERRKRSRHNYLPFGEELTAGTGGRTTAQGYSASDGIRQQFIDKERDTETGLDFFEARYYASIQGRFTSVDPENAGASVLHPQSWNAYAYSLNNPLRFIDPNGLKWAQVAVEGGIQYQWFDDKEKDDNGQTAYDRALATGWSAVVFDKSGSLSFTTGLLAPGRILTTTTLNEDSEHPSISTHTVTWGEWAKWYTANAFMDPILGQDKAGQMLDDYLSSMLGMQTHGSLPAGPSVPGPALGSSFGEPNTPIDKQLAGKGQLKDLRSNPNLKGVDIDDLLKKTPAQVEEMAKEGKITQRVVKAIKKAFEGRDLGGRGKTK